MYIGFRLLVLSQENNKYFELKNAWGAPNLNYLLVMVSTFVMPFSMDPLSPRMTPDASHKSSMNASGY